MIPAPYRLPSQIGSDMLTAKVIAAGGRAPHGDNTAQSKASYTLTAWMINLGILRHFMWLTGTARVRQRWALHCY